MAIQDVFSAEELARLRGFPEINRAELIRYFTLTGADEAFVRQFRTGRNVLGVAVQLCTLPWLGYVPDEVTLAPDAVVGRLSQRLGIAIGELRGYGEREQTRTDHLREVAGYAGWRSMDTAEWKDLDEFLFARAMEHDSPKLLFRLACEYLLSSRVLRPGVILLLRRVAAARAHARTETWARVRHLLSDRRALTSAIKEYGELRRTVYAARYLADETYRRRISRQLNKGENLHALRRSLAYAGEGAVWRRHHEQQTEQMWCLTLATNAIVCWSTEYPGLGAAALRQTGRDVDDEVLAHIWPTHHENVHFYGTHSVDIDGELAQLDTDGYRPLRLAQAAAATS